MVTDTTSAAPSLRVDRERDLPVGVQLAWRLRALIATGGLASGDRLPSVREVAEQAGVNANTVRAVYGRLERDGLIASRHGLGTFVAPGAAASPELKRLAGETIAEARRAGVDPTEVARAICASEWDAQDDLTAPDRALALDDGGRSTGETLPDIGTETDEAAARRELRRQIGRLEAELASYPEARPSEATHPALAPKAHVAGVGELERVRDELMERLKGAREAAERKGERQQRARARRERIAGDPEAHRWQRVGNEDAGDPGCGETRAVPRWGPIGAIAGWWRVKVSSGCPLAAAA